MYSQTKRLMRISTRAVSILSMDGIFSNFLLQFPLSHRMYLLYVRNCCDFAESLIWYDITCTSTSSMNEN
jgi:hypothetical protein